MESKPEPWGPIRFMWRLPDGREHREDGPAYSNEEYGIHWWYIEGKRHRLDGPAIVWTKSHCHEQNGWWFINGHNVDKKIKEWSNEIGIDLDNLSEDDKLIIELGWSSYGK